MNLLRSICCLFGSRCAPEETKSPGDRAKQSTSADLGQREADLEKTGKEQMSHMEGSGATGRKSESGADLLKGRHSRRGRHFNFL